MRLISSVKSARHSEKKSVFSEEKISYLIRLRFQTGHKFVKILLILERPSRSHILKSKEGELNVKYVETDFYEH